MSAQKIKVNVLFFGACREVAGVSELQCELDAPAHARTAWAHINKLYPELERFERSALFAVNEEHVRMDHPLQDGDTLAIFPPVSGG